MISKGVQFGDIHSYNDLDLMFAPFVIPPAIPKTNLLDIPAGDGSLDLTQALGEVRYKDREFVMKFTVNPHSEMTFDEKVMQVSNLLNGKEFRITLDRDADWYWQGRCIVNEHLQNKTINQITIKAIVRPYKLKQEVTEASFTLSSVEQTVTLTNDRKTVMPEIICSANGAKITVGSATYVLQKGSQSLLEIMFTEGENKVTISGSGTMTFIYQEGAL